MRIRNLLAGLFFSSSLFGAACAHQTALDPKETLPLPGTSYYPESLGASDDGTILIGSLATGQVTRFAPGSDVGTPFLANGGEAQGVTGVLVDDASGSVYLCAIDPTFKDLAQNQLRRYDLATGQRLESYSFPSANICNDMAFDHNGHLYVTDSTGRIYRLAKGEKQLTLWTDDAQLAPPPNGFGADGISFDGTDTLYVNSFSNGKLFRIRIEADGHAGPVQEIAVTPRLESPDGMRQVDRSTLIVVEGAGRLTRVSVAGTTATASVLQSGLDGPTSVVQVGDRYVVTEGQLGHFLDPASGPPAPFRSRSFPATR